MGLKNIYLLGIGGIGMSALARYFLHEGRVVGGYDRTQSPLTAELESEGARIHYSDDVAMIGDEFRDPRTTLVVYTPAVPSDHGEMMWFREQGFTLEKRSEMLGHLSEGKYVMAIAGTHGKTSTTTLTAWLNHISAHAGKGGDGTGSAFLGGISKNFGSNLVLGSGNRMAIEADEYDRSFLRLRPDVAVITSADADHLDIYGTHEAMKGAFSQFVAQIKSGGALILKNGVDIELPNGEIEVYRYSFDKPSVTDVIRSARTHFYAKNIVLKRGGYYDFDIVCPDRVIEGCRLGVPGWINIENAVAAVGLMWVAGFDEERLKEALASFGGVKRRFEFYVNTPQAVYMDDYAHHPRELEAALSSIKEMFPDRRVTALFQPHLYTRTRDFYMEFGRALSLADEVILLPIYPAREQPIEGISSEIIAANVSVPCQIVPKEKLIKELERHNTDVLVSFGAGDIDRYCEAIAQVVKRKIEK